MIPYSTMANENATISRTGSQYKKYDISFKLRAVECAKSTNKSNAAKQCGVDVKRVREWCKNEEKLREELNGGGGGGKRSRLSGGGRKVSNETLQQELVDWINAMRNQLNVRVSRKQIQEKAMEIYERMRGENPDLPAFNASNGWVQKFMDRNGGYDLELYDSSDFT